MGPGGSFPCNVRVCTAAVLRLLIVVLGLVSLEAALVCAGETHLDEELGSRNLIHFLLGITSAKEENLVKKVHAAPSLSLGYGHIWFKRNLQEVSIDGLYCRPKTVLEDLNSSILMELDLSYSNLFPVLTGERTAFFVGPTGKLRYSLSYYPDWDDSHLYWGDFLAMGAKASLIRRFRGNRTGVVTVDLPLLALFSRPDANRLYKYDDISLGGVLKSLHDDIKLGWWAHVLYVDVRAGYQFSLSQTVQHTVFYSLDYSRVKDAEGAPLKVLTHNLGLEVGW